MTFNTDPTTLFILALLLVNTVLRWRTYRMEKARKLRAERRWMYLQSSVNERGGR